MRIVAGIILVNCFVKGCIQTICHQISHILNEHIHFLWRYHQIMAERRKHLMNEPALLILRQRSDNTKEGLAMLLFREVLFTELFLLAKGHSCWRECP